MKSRITLCGLLLGLTLANLTTGLTAQEKTEAKPTFASVLDHQLSSVEKTVVGAADAMPEAKYDFAPTTQGEFKGVRTFGLEVKHMAVANYALGAGILGEKPPIDLGGPNGPASIKTKAEIMKFLNDSFVYAHKAVNSINEANILEPIKAPFGNSMTTRLGIAVSLISHPFDHYGQMVEYLRMNSIIPPASRQ
jgi:DinB superfamily